ncbi:MAG: tetratricopeptide repeat protein [Parachlamydiaceae bacterium]|nr:tetratricopeptide repeat protein [Parachlamydiaceae bacterium]
MTSQNSLPHIGRQSNYVPAGYVPAEQSIPLDSTGQKALIAEVFRQKAIEKRGDDIRLNTSRFEEALPKNAQKILKSILKNQDQIAATQKPKKEEQDISFSVIVTRNHQGAGAGAATFIPSDLPSSRSHSQPKRPSAPKPEKVDSIRTDRFKLQQGARNVGAGSASSSGASAGAAGSSSSAGSVKHTSGYEYSRQPRDTLAAMLLKKPSVHSKLLPSVENQFSNLSSKVTLAFNVENLTINAKTCYMSHDFLNVIKFVDLIIAHSLDGKVDTQLFYFRGMAHRNLKNHDAAIGDLKKALNKGPDDVIILIELGKLYYESRDYIRCIRATTMGIEIAQTQDLDYSLATIFYIRGMAHRELKKPREAIDDMNKGLNYSPNDLNLLIELAQTYMDIKAFERCIREATKVLDLTKNQAQTDERVYHAYKLRGISYFVLNKEEEAHQDLKNAYRLVTPNILAKMNRDDYYVYEYLGRIYFSHQRYDKALRYLVKATQIGKDAYAINWILRGEIARLVHNYDEAQEFFAKASQCKKNSYEYHWYYGKLLFDLNDFKEAIKHFDIYSEKLKQPSAGVLAYRADAHHKMGLTSVAKQDLELSLKLEENNLLALECAANLYYETGEYDKADIYIERAISLNPGDEVLEAIQKKILLKLKIPISAEAVSNALSLS